MKLTTTVTLVVPILAALANSKPLKDRSINPNPIFERGTPEPVIEPLPEIPEPVTIPEPGAEPGITFDPSNPGGGGITDPEQHPAPAPAPAPEPAPQDPPAAPEPAPQDPPAAPAIPAPAPASPSVDDLNFPELSPRPRQGSLAPAAQIPNLEPLLERIARALEGPGNSFGHGNDNGGNPALAAPAELAAPKAPNAGIANTGTVIGAANALISIVLAGFAIEVAVKQLPIFSLQSSLASAQLSSLSSVAATAKPAKRTEIPTSPAFVTVTTTASTLPTSTKLSSSLPALVPRQTALPSASPSDISTITNSNVTDDSGNTICTFGTDLLCHMSTFAAKVSCPDPVDLPTPDTDMFAVRQSICGGSGVSNATSGAVFGEATSVGSNCWAGFQAVIAICGRLNGSPGGTWMDGGEKYVISPTPVSG